MPAPSFDVLIIGGGPGGAAAATFLARAGRRVLLLEKDRFPRFHIGESLLPYNRRIFEEMGILEELQSAGFPRKLGAQFHLGNGTQSLKFTFGAGRFTEEPEAFQVERSKFDHLLLQHARRQGAEVREGWTVQKYENTGDSVTLAAQGPDGAAERFTGSFLVDASGRSNLTGNQEKLRIVHPNLKKFAIFGHFHGVRLDEGPRAGDTVIVRLENKWFWLIPISPEKVSVGCVLDQRELVESKSSPADLFHQIWQSSSVLRDRLQHAELTAPLQTTSDFSYYNRQLIGPRLLRVGDAAGFMDPIFSAGVYLAMFSGKLASETILKSLASPKAAPRYLRDYENRVFHGMKFYWELVENFYTQPFLEVFFNPREKFQLASAVNAALAGRLDGGWKLRWRLRLFYAIVRLQQRWPFLPRLSFSEPK